MTKNELKEIVQVCIENTWYKRRSIDPVSEQTEFLTDALWNRFNSMLNDEKNIIKFAVYLTGHDAQTIEQMYKDWQTTNI